MNRGVLYLLLACITAVTSLLVPSWLQWFFMWITIAASYFGAGYYSGYGEMLMKSSKGRIPVYLKILLFPVLVGATLYNILARKLDNEEPMNLIRPGLWLGRRLTLAERPLLLENGITAVLDVTAEFDSPGSWFLPNDIEYFNIPIFDRMEPRQSQLLKAVNWIDKQRDAGKSVLIHCALGQGRSVTMLMAYLLHIEPQHNVDDLLLTIKDKRQTAEPNGRQLSLLRDAHESGFLKQHPKIFIVFNPVSGTREPEDDLAVIEECIGPFFEYSVIQTSPEKSAESITQDAIAQGATMVVAAGGDGTVTAVASVFRDTDVILGVIPRGTANAFAVCMYGAAIRLNPVRLCCEHIVSGVAKRIDAVQVNDRTMLLLAGIGMEAGMVKRAERDLKNRWGVLAYLLGGWQQLDALSLFEATITIDGDTHRFTTGSVTVANAAPYSSVFAQGGGQPALDDGHLDVTVITNVAEKAAAIKIMSELFIGAITQDDGPKTECIKHFRGKHIELSAEPPQTLVLDGELIGETPVSFQVLPGALRVAYAP